MEPAPDETIITTDESFADETKGPMRVRPGVTLRLEGTHAGPLALESGAELRVTGVLRGALDIGSTATATVSGEVIGPIEIRIAGTLVVENGGRVIGPVSNFGSFTNHGVRSGPILGRHPDDRPGSTQLPSRV
jgi:hypothetical protein